MIDELWQSVAGLFAFSLSTVRALTAVPVVLALAALVWITGLLVVLTHPR